MSDAGAIAVQIAIAAVPAIFAIILHELAHGYAAWALGDDTARRAGRLSLNPFRHVDRTGTILVPGVLLLSQLLTIHRVAFMFGWARPVPVSAARLRDPRRMMMLIAAAGPMMNFALAWLAALALHGVDWLPPAPGDIAAAMLQFFILYNLALGLFNLLPVPPLDGGRIVVGLLPLPVARLWAEIERVGIYLVIIVVVLLPQLLAQVGLRFDPLRAALDRVLPWAYGFVLHLAGRANVGT